MLIKHVHKIITILLLNNLYPMSDLIKKNGDENKKV